MNNRYSALIFTLKNSQVCYASIIQFIQKLDKLFNSPEMHLDGRDLLCLKRAGIGEVYRFFPQSNNVESMMRLVSQSICRENCVTEGVLERMEAYVRNAGTEDFRFILVVDAKLKMDHFEESFQYLLTAWREYSGRIFFCIDNDTGDIRSTQSTYFMVSHYLLFTLLTGNKTYLNTSLNRIINADPQSFYNSIYAWNYLPGQTGRAEQKKSLVHLALNGKLMKLSSFTKFYPVLPIDADTQSILSGSVRSVFQQDWSYKQLREVIEQQPVEVLHLQNAVNGYRGISLEMLKAMCLNYLLEADELTEDDEKNAEDKRNLYDDMSMLAFFIYSIYMYFLNKQKVRASLTRDQKLALISDVQDFAVGMLQLVDNTVRHSSTGFGCFSVRIFFAESGRNHSGLPVEYSQYVDKAPDKQYYLEMRLIDSFCPTSDTANQFSADSCIMKTVFLRNLELRSFEAEDAAEQICRFRKKFKSATLSDFFDPKCSNDHPDQFSISDWDTYYDITENTLHHYGLMQFNAILKGHGGYFSVRSGTGYDRNPDCYYDTEGGTGGETYLPGTQYAVLLPIQLKLQQQYATGFSVPEAETDFSSLLYLTEQKCLELPEVVRSLWQACDVNNHAQVSRLISDYLAGHLVSAEKIYTFDFSALQKLDGVDGLNSILAREVFLKGLFHFIKMRFSSQSDCPVLRLAFTHCTHAVLLEIVELFCSFYKRSAKCKEMSGVEIYLSGEDCREEFLIAGEDLLAATTIARQMSFSKGRFSPLQRVLDCKIWNRFSNQSESSEGHEICLPKLVPYDLIVTSDKSGRECLFQSAVRKTLITDLQCRDFGCCVYGIHVRVGSKIHVTERFYEAQELFHTSQYLSRFAYLVAQKITAMKQRPGRLILVGYETYSELLVLSVENMLREIFRYGEKHPTPNQAIMHIIYENMPGTQPARLRTSIQGSLTEQDNLILLVPINSTLSTHNKVKAALEKDERFAVCAKVGIMKNFGLILIRHGETERLTREEMQYWESVDCNNWTVKAPRLIDPPVDYIVSVRTTWENPLLCKLCYPADCTEERPLIGTNKASVIPTYMIGLTEDHPAENYISQSEEAAVPAPLVPFSRKNPRDRTKWFQKLFIPETYRYGHFNYYGNDFQFYFDMELMLGQILQDNFLRKKLDKWFASVHDAIFPNKEGPHPYNIIIAPEQPQNAGWINYVSQRLFRDSSDILHFDVLKEYRDNVKAKFSNITALYNNLIHADESATIHFHFVDSSFCSGRTIARARTLIQSLFPEDAFNGTGNVQIKIFESILVLLNRSSADSQRSQVTNGKFFSFISLKVPNLRNHQDACVLCNLVQEFDNLALRAASNEIAQEWARKAEKLKVQHLETPRQRVQKPGRAYERAYRRLACSQQAYVWLSELGYRCNQTSDVLDMLWELCYFNQIDTRAIRKHLKKKNLPSGKIWTEIKKNWFEPGACIPDWVRVLTAELVDPSKIHKYVNDIGLYIETLISYIKVFSRPFLTFRKSVIEASFRWRLLLLDALLTPERATPAARAALTPVYAYLETGEGPNNYQLLLAFFKALVGGLTKNGSNFVIRSENYGRLLRYYTETLKPLLPEKCREAAEREFLNWYLCNIKRLIDSNGDETKSLWLHYLLLTGEECTRSHLDIAGAAAKKLIPPKGLDRGLTERIYLENNRIIYDGIVDLYENRLDFESPSSPVPYYLENFVSFICSDYGIRNDQNPLFKDGGSDVYKQVYGMVGLYEILCSKKGGSEAFYDKLKFYILNASGADRAELLGATQTEDSLKAIKDSLRSEYASRLHPNKDAPDWERVQLLTRAQKGVTPYVIGKSSDFSKPQFAKLLWLQKALLTFINGGCMLPDAERISESVLLDRGSGYIVAKIDPGSQDAGAQGQAKIEPLYIALYRADRDDFALLRGMRNILAFRAMFVERLKVDFNNSLMQEFALTREKADYLGQSRAAGHTQSAIINLLVNKLSNTDDPERNPDILRGYALRGLADQTCSHWYSDFVSNGNVIPVLQSVNESQTVDLLTVVASLNGTTFQILPGDARDVSYKRNSKLWLRDNLGNDHAIGDITALKESVFQAWGQIYLSGRLSDVVSMFALLIINACRHGESDSVSVQEEEIEGGLPSKRMESEEVMDIVLSCDGRYVSFTNRILPEEGDETKRQMERSAYQRPNRDEGISMWVINEFFKRALIQAYFTMFDWKRPNLTKEVEEMMERIQGLDAQCLQFEFGRDKMPSTNENLYDVLRVKIPVLRLDGDPHSEKRSKVL